ncbi:MAG: hypothetical protein MZU97_01685 [Bacillus subtilis]|nr:hypothetical protein [Bacillus subtilis]
MTINFNDNHNISLSELWHLKTRIKSIRELIDYKQSLLISKFGDICEDDIIQKFKFSQMVKDYPEYCVMLENGEICHNLDKDELNCLGCNCPNYKLEISYDAEKELYKIGICSINSKFGSYKISSIKSDLRKKYLILNCKNCSVPHRARFIKKYFFRNNF